MENGQLVDGRYRILSRLGASAKGAVYVAEQLESRRKVALKRIRPQVANRELVAERFERTAHAVSSIDHPNVVRVLDFGALDSGEFFLIMELLEGRDLASLLRETRRLPWPRARRLVHQLVRGLAAVHDHGIIHRGVEPRSCFLLDPKPGLEPDRAKVLGYGAAKLDTGISDATRPSRESRVMVTGVYMAPEQAESGVSDARSDIYALGVVIYELLTGQPPFWADTMIQTVIRHITTPPRPLRELVPELPAQVEAFVLGMLAKDPFERHQSMNEVEAALASLGAGASARDVPDPPGAPTDVLSPPGAPTDVISLHFVPTVADADDAPACAATLA